MIIVVDDTVVKSNETEIEHIEEDDFFHPTNFLFESVCMH